MPRPARAALVAGAVSAALFAMIRVPLSAQAGTGTIRGRVRLSAAPPANPPIRMGADPACSQLYGSTRPVQEFVVVSSDGGLANAFVHLQGHFSETPLPASVVTLDQKGCVYRPHVIGMRAGQTLEVRNSDPTVHNLHSVSARGNDFNISRPQNQPPVSVPVRAEEMMLRITCDIHSWMNIYVGVVQHPYFAVSGADGRFEIANVPAGSRPIQVWHERYGPLNAVANVTAGQTTDVDFTYAGTEKAAPPTVRLSLPADFSLRLTQ